MTAGGRH